MDRTHSNFWPCPQIQKGLVQGITHHYFLLIRFEQFILEISCRVGLGMCEVPSVPLHFRKRLSLASLYGSLCKLLDGQPLGVAWSDIYTPLARRNVLIFLVFLGNTTGMEVISPRNGHGIWEIMTNSEIRSFSTRPYMVSASRTQLLVAVMVGTEGPYWDPTWMIISYYFSLGSTEEGRVNVEFFLVRSWGCRLKL